MRVSDFVFDCFHLLYYRCHKINPYRGLSYVDSPNYIKNKIAIIDPINKKYSQCFHYAVTVALNHEKKNRKKFAKNIKTLAFYK